MTSAEIPTAPIYASTVADLGDDPLSIADLGAYAGYASPRPRDEKGRYLPKMATQPKPKKKPQA